MTRANRSTSLFPKGTFHFNGKHRTLTLGIDPLNVWRSTDPAQCLEGTIIMRRWQENVVEANIKVLGFHLSFKRQRNVNRHLVTVSVGVEGRTDQWVQLNGLPSINTGSKA